MIYNNGTSQVLTYSAPTTFDINKHFEGSCELLRLELCSIDVHNVG